MKKLLLGLVLSHSYQVSRFVLYSGSAADITTTLKIPGSESNPVLGQNQVRQVLIVSGLTIGLDLFTNKIRETHPQLATTTNFLTGAEHIGAAIYNIKLGDKK